MLGPLDKLLNRSKATSRGASAVVTGAGSGIGAAFAVELARRGGAVVCSDIDEAAAARTADTIVEQGAKAVAVRCDVSRFDDVQAFLCFTQLKLRPTRQYIDLVGIPVVEQFDHTHLLRLTRRLHRLTEEIDHLERERDRAARRVR